MSDENDKPPAPKRPTAAGQSGSARDIGAALGGDLDFEPDALLDSLFDDPGPLEELPPTSQPGPTLHVPDDRGYPADEITMTGRVPGADAPAAPRPRVPRAEATATPPAVNPAGPPPRAPFPLASSPVAPRTAPLPAIVDVDRPPARARLDVSPLGRTVPQRPSPIAKQGGVDPLGKTALAAPSPRPASATLDDRVTPVPSSSATPPTERSEQPVAPPSRSSTLDDLEADSLDFEALGAEVLAEPSAAAPEAPADPSEPSPANEAAALEGLGEDVPLEAFDDEEPEPEPEPERAAPVVEPAAEAPSWADERRASAHLAEQRATEVMRARAEWLEAEATRSEDPAVRGRTLVVTAELWAMLDDMTRARKCAAEAMRAAPTLQVAARMSRWLAAQEGDWKAVTTALEGEVRGAPTPETRAHAAALSAEIHRAVSQDAVMAQRKLDQISRLLPGDPRPHVHRFAAMLAAGGAPPKMKWPDELGQLAGAAANLAELRGAAPGPGAEPAPALLTFVRAGRALAAGDRGAAGEALERLAALPELAEPVRWLCAALFAHDAEHRPRAIEALTALAGSAPTPAVLRALAARALEQGDARGVEAAISGRDDSASDPFTPADRVALAALTGGDPVVVRPWVAAMASDEARRPLAAAAAAAATEGGKVPDVWAGSGASRAAAAFGRTLVAGTLDDGFREALASLAAAAPDSPAVRLFGLEIALGARSASDVAGALAAWRPGEPDRDAHLARALALELGQSADEARSAYAAALGSDEDAECAVRALLPASDPRSAATLLAGVARALPDDAGRSLLLVEAATRLGAQGDAELYAGLLGEAASARPSLPLAYARGELLARAQGEQDRLLDWVRRRREAATDPLERGLDLVREALLIADEEAATAGALLEDAARARPSDVGLRELHERLAAPEPAQRAAWREAAAQSAEPDTKSRLLLEAALEYERGGDMESASRAATGAVEAGGGAIAAVVAERTTGASSGAARLAETLLARAKQEEDPIAQRELYEQLAAIDAGRGDQASARLWHSAILESHPSYLPSLAYLESALLAEGRIDDLGPTALTLAKELPEPESSAHAVLAARIAVNAGELADAAPAIAIAAAQPQPTLWALRGAAAMATLGSNPADELASVLRLVERVGRPRDQAALLARAAEAARLTGKDDEARSLLERVAELAPDHLPAARRRAEVLAHSDQATEAAEAFEVVAQLSRVDGHRLDAWYRAAVLWLDRTENVERGVSALEQASAIDVRQDDVFRRLQAAYVAAQDSTRLAALLERRLDATTDPAERVALEVTRGRALAEVGERDAARQALAAALDANPDHTDALDAFADLCAAEGDWEGAEQAWIRLARNAQEPERQAEIYRKLGGLYDGNLPNPQRAELAYKEVLKRQPNDVDGKVRLVDVYGRLGQPADAIRLATELVNAATNPDEKRDRTLALAAVHERTAGDRRQAESVLDKARKAWPQSAEVLMALAAFHQRHGETAALNVLLDRAANDARRALNTGRFDPSFFEILAVVAELRSGPDAAAIAKATLGALRGEDVSVRGAGLGAGDARLDELIAPELLTAPLRSLLRKTGPALDNAYALDPKSLRAAPLPAQAADVGAQFRQAAAAFGIQNLDVLVSNAIGPVCMPLSANPPQIVFGSALLESTDDAVRSFLFVRAVKVLQSNAAALARTAPIDLWPVIAALLRTFTPDWQPQGVDARKLAEAEAKIKRTLPSRIDDDVAVLALEVSGAIGNRASQLATAIHEFGNRAALLAVGDPNAAVRGVALAGGHQDVPTEGVERLKWIVRNPEARDLAVFSVSDAYAEARKRLGLAG